MFRYNHSGREKWGVEGKQVTSGGEISIQWYCYMFSKEAYYGQQIIKTVMYFTSGIKGEDMI
jgi:hypothetical protein